MLVIDFEDAKQAASGGIVVARLEGGDIADPTGDPEPEPVVDDDDSDVVVTFKPPVPKATTGSACRRRACALCRASGPATAEGVTSVRGSVHGRAIYTPP
jgi:hypothetical protein